MMKGALRAATIALFATAASVAAPSSARAQDITCERGDLEVRGLEFRGNTAIGGDDLSLRVVTTPSSRARRTLGLPLGEKRCLNRTELGRDITRLKEYYRQRGYYSAQVDTIVQQIVPGFVRVIFQVVEGQPTRVTSYVVTGLDSVEGGNEILRRLQLRVGGPFDLRLYGADIDTIIHRLRNAGYYRADHVKGHDLDTTSVGGADAFVTVLPGKRARFGEPVFEITPVEGRARQIAEHVVRRVLGIAPGSQYSDQAIINAQRNLYLLGTYRHIEIAPLPDSLQPPGDTIVVLAVRLTEDYMRQLDSEFGWATLDCVRLRLQYTDKNLFGTARRLELSGQASKIGFGAPVATEATKNWCTLGGKSPLADDSEFSSRLYYFTGLAIRQPRLLGTRWVPTLSLYSERRGEFKAYLRTTQVGADLSATRDLRDRMPLRLAYTFEFGDTEASDAAYCALFNRCDEGARQQLKQRLPLGVGSASIARNRTDNLVSPTRGTLVRAEIRSSAAKMLGTSNDLFFSKGTGDVAWYYRVDSRNVLAFRLRGGIVLGRRLSLSDPSNFVPPQERLYAGGPTSVRGFQQNELGALVYIAARESVDSTTVLGPGTDTTYRFFVSAHPDSIDSPDRSVPLGGNSLVVANIEYRVRDPFLFPDLLQYTFFVDGGNVWTRGKGAQTIKWTPGLGIRALTPVGPVQVNIGYNRYNREPGAIFYNPDIQTLACATPGNSITYIRGPSTGGQLQQQGVASCRDDFSPPTRSGFFQRLTFTFSIGPDF